MNRGSIIAAGGSFTGHSFSAADSPYTFMVNSISCSEIFQRYSFSSKVQHFFCLSLCEYSDKPYVTFAADDFYTTDSHVIPCCDVFHRHPVSTKFQYFCSLLCRYFGSAMAVFFCCNRIKVIGVYAAAHFAKMIELQTFWNRSDDQCVEIPVGIPALVAMVGVPSRHKRVAACLVDVPVPNPAWRIVSTVLQYKGVWKFVGVAVDIVPGLAFFVSRSFILVLRYLRFLAAPTFTKAIIHISCASSTTIAWSVI